MSLFMFAFGFGTGPITWTYWVDILPDIGIGVCSMFDFGLSAVIGYIRNWIDDL